jgi:hypothetical protein
MDNQKIDEISIKRKYHRCRGGQPGNQNARKHGFYSSALTPSEINDFLNILKNGNIDREPALLRLKLKTALERDPGNRRVLVSISGLLAGWYRFKYGLSHTEGIQLKKFVMSLLENRSCISLISETTQIHANKQNNMF